MCDICHEPFHSGPRQNSGSCDDSSAPACWPTLKRGRCSIPKCARAMASANTVQAAPGSATTPWKQGKPPGGVLHRSNVRASCLVHVHNACPCSLAAGNVCVQSSAPYHTPHNTLLWKAAAPKPPDAIVTTVDLKATANPVRPANGGVENAQRTWSLSWGRPDIKLVTEVPHVATP